VDISITPTKLSGVVIIRTDFFRDQRGYFIESYHKQRFDEHGLAYEFVQDNHSRSGQNVLRGIHYQDMTAPMGKLVRCTEGSIFDVAVDLRVGSPTLGQWVGVELSEENQDQLMVPAGFGHAFVALSPFAQVAYKCTGYYTPQAEGTIRWDDPDLGIDWPTRDPIVSERDRNGMSFRQYLERPAFGFEGWSPC
jgi:dTDP-4-dehydrorhamnose 3,5-epimerase